MEQRLPTKTKRISSSNQYIDNKQMLGIMKTYRTAFVAAKESGQPIPPIPESGAVCIMQIAENLAKKRNFSGYSWVEDMIGDGIENCIKYFGNFNPEKSDNPFAYFTQICYYAFIRRIEIEKNQLQIVESMKEDSMAFLDYTEHDGADYTSTTIQRAQMEFYRNRHSGSEHDE